MKPFLVICKKDVLMRSSIWPWFIIRIVLITTGGRPTARNIPSLTRLKLVFLLSDTCLICNKQRATKVFISLDVNDTLVASLIIFC